MYVSMYVHVHVHVCIFNFRDKQGLVLGIQALGLSFGATGFPTQRRGKFCVMRRGHPLRVLDLFLPVPNPKAFTLSLNPSAHGAPLTPLDRQRPSSLRVSSDIPDRSCSDRVEIISGMYICRVAGGRNRRVTHNM